MVSTPPALGAVFAAAGALPPPAGALAGAAAPQASEVSASAAVKPANESGGYGMLIGPMATQAQIEEFRAKAARGLLEHGVRVVLFTDGGEGVRVITPEEEYVVSVPEVEVVDTVGAGDSFGGGFLAFWLARGPEPVGRTLRGREAIRKTLADLVAEYHYDQLTDLLHARGMVRVATMDESNPLWDRELAPQCMGWRRPVVRGGVRAGRAKLDFSA